MTILDYPEGTKPHTKTSYIIVYESRTDNLIDLFSGLAIIGLGWLLAIPPISWFGVSIGVLMVGARLFQPDNVYRCSSIADAVDVLDALDEEDEGEI